MSRKKKGKYWYGETLDDLRAEIVSYSQSNGYEAVQFAPSICRCGLRVFRLETDEDEGVARRTCAECAVDQFMGDSAQYADGADLFRHGCICDAEEFQLLSGVALYGDSNDVRWHYIGCHCTNCGLVGVFADWKCEAGDAEAFLKKV